MTANEFRERYKRLFVALEGYYKWGRAMSRCSDFVVAWDDSKVYELRIYSTGKLPFVLRMWGGATRRYSRESSVLAALARIHKGQTP